MNEPPDAFRPETQLVVDARKVSRALMLVVVLLVVAHVAGTVARYLLHYDFAFGLIDTFNLNYENNVPTFFAAFLLLACAVLLALVARTQRGRMEQRRWQGLAVVFAFLAVDEDASLHELLIDPVRELLPVNGPLLFAWVIPYGLALLALAVVYGRFVLSLPAPTRGRLAAAAGLYLAGALGCELLGGWYLSRQAGVEDLGYYLLVAVEETLEMAGVVVFIHALLQVLGERLQGQPLRIAFRRRAQDSSSSPR